MAAFGGLRRGELVTLRVRDIDFTNRVLRVEGSYGLGVLKAPKSGRVRSVPMAAEVEKALARLLTERGDPGANELVFLGEGGATSTRLRSDAATRPRRRPRGFARSASTTLGTRSGRWRSDTAASCVSPASGAKLLQEGRSFVACVPHDVHVIHARPNRSELARQVELAQRAALCEADPQRRDCPPVRR